MLKIRLSRVGRKHDPSYRLVVIEKGRGPQSGDYIEKVGTYDARTDAFDPVVDRIEYWLSVGAQPSDTVHNLLVKAEVIDSDTKNPLPKKTPIVDESEESDTDEEANGDDSKSEAETNSDEQESEESAQSDGEDTEDED